MSRNMAKRLALLSCCAMLFTTQSASAETINLTLEQAVSMALEKNRDIHKAKEYARYVQGRFVEERSAALPQIGLNSGIGMSKDESMKASAGVATRQTVGSLDLTVSQPLYTFGKIGAAIRAAEVGLKTADEQLRLYRQAAWRDTATAWYDVLLAKELKQLSEENLKQKERHLDEAKKKFAAGVATDYDVLAAEVALSNARPEVIRSANSLKMSRERLRFLLAEQNDVDVSGELAVADHKTNEEFASAFATAKQYRPELADLRHRVGIYKEMVTIADAENKPRIDFRGGAGWHSLALYPAGAKSEASGMAWNAGIYLTFPFFDGLKSSGRVTEAKSDLRNKELDAEKLVDSISLEIRNALNALQEANEILAASGGTVQQAQRLLEMSEKGYQFGVKTRLEVDDAQLNLLQAKNSLARSKRDYLAAVVNYRWAIGRLGE